MKVANLGLYGIAVGWRCAHDAHVASPHERELQCARDGRRRHGERVDIGLQLAQFLLGRHAKLLFLVDDEQSEVFPFHGLADELVGADENVDLCLPPSPASTCASVWPCGHATGSPPVQGSPSVVSRTS